MDRYSKMQYLKSIYQRYHKSTRKGKREILNEFCTTCEYNRKYAIRLLNAPPSDEKNKHTKKRNNIYSDTVISILESIWEASGYLWSQRLKSALPLWLPWAKQNLNITPNIEKQILSISPAQIDRRLKNKRNRAKKKIYGTTRPGTLLKHQIQIKTDNWDVNIPGFLEIDTVSHSGSSADGDFILSLNCTDIHTTWTETRAVMGKGQTLTLDAIIDIKNSLPFALRGIDSDNGSEFINYHLKRFCDNNKIQFTRSRPYKKDDNAHIEQKNWTHVRKIFGYVRYDTKLALNLMNDIYRNELRLFHNFFQPSVKLVKKIRIGSKLRRIYDKPETPFQRVCKCKDVNTVKVAQLKKVFLALNPFILSKTIDAKLTKIYNAASKSKKIQGNFKTEPYIVNNSVSSNLWLHSHLSA